MIDNEYTPFVQGITTVSPSQNNAPLITLWILVQSYS